MSSELREPFENPGNVEEGDIQPAQAALGLEFHRFQEQPIVEERAIQANGGVAVQPTQAGFGLDSHSFQEHPNGEGRSIWANGVGVQPTQAALPNLADLIDPDHLVPLPEQDRQNLLQDFGFNEPAGLEDPIHGEVDNGIEAHTDNRQMQNREEDQNYLRNVWSEWVDNNGLQAQIGSQQMQNHEEENGIHDGSALQPLLSDQNYLRIFWPELAELPIDGEEDNGIQAQIDSQQMQNCEEDNGIHHNGIHDRNMLRAFPPDLRNDGWIELADLDEPLDSYMEDPIGGEVDDDIQVQTDSQMENHEEDNGIQARIGSQQMQDGFPQQGTAGRRMRLQVPLGGAKWPSESKRVSIASSERTCVCGGMSLEQEAGSSCSLCHAFMSNQSILNMEGGTKGPICAEGLVSCVAESADVAQQSPQDVSGSSTPRLLSLTSLVSLLLGLLGEACVLPAFAATLAAELPIETVGYLRQNLKVGNP